MDKWMKILTGLMPLRRLLGKLCPWVLPDGAGERPGAGTQIAFAGSATHVLCDL